MGRFSRGVYPFVCKLMKKIELTRGKYSLVDDEDFDRLNVSKWCCTDNGYAKRGIPGGTSLYLHREIIKNIPDGMVIDHINGDRLDNRKENLRVCRQSDNAKNNVRSIGKSGFPGVYINGSNPNKIFAARIRVNMKNVWLGRFKTAEEAHRVYVDACNKYHGSFSKYNREKVVKNEVLVM